MKLLLISFCQFLGIFLRLASVSAEVLPLTIDEVVAKALDSSPLVKEIEAARALRSADAFDSHTLSNPTFEAEGGVPTAWRDQRGDQEVSVSLVQPVRISQGKLRSRVASLLEKTGNAEREQSVLEVISKTRLAFARLWLLSERERVLKQMEPRAKSLESFVVSGVKQGGYGAGDAAVFKTEIGRADAEALKIAAETLAAESELAALTGLDVAGRTLASPGSPKSISESSVREQLSNNSLKVQSRAQILLALSKAELAVANRDAFPELRPKLFYTRTNEGVDLVGLGVSFDLPFYSRNTSDRIRKGSSTMAAEANNNFVQGEVFRSSVLKSVRQYELRSQELAIYECRIIPDIKEALKSFESQVRSGQGSVFQLWQTLREYLDIQKTYLERWSNTFSDYEQLSILLGQEP